MEEEILEKLELLKKAGCKMVKCKVVDKNIELNKKIIELKNNSIPTSVIQEKIMKLNLEIEKLQIEYEKEVVFAYKQVNIGKQTMLSEKVKILQEILEEGRR